MFTLVIYDITEDELRAKIAQVCKKHGLTRVQKSAFLGRIPSGLRKELIASFRRLIEGTENNIQVYVICRADISLKIELGKPYKGEESEMLI
ncbi:CRISPR-associated endonuclease Cas2 [Candidatus Bathyarchaeota archaeon]|nr:CRISPR-associated endonuclease Cas2 [Candidatus Bathyarchaeota archaeon]